MTTKNREDRKIKLSQNRPTDEGHLNWWQWSLMSEFWLLKQDQQMTSRRDFGPWPMGALPIQRWSVVSLARW